MAPRGHTFLVIISLFHIAFTAGRRTLVRRPQTVDKIELYLGFVYFLFFQVRALSDTLSLRGTPRSGPSSQAFCKDFPPHSNAIASELRGQVFCISLLLALSSVIAYGLTVAKCRRPPKVTARSAPETFASDLESLKLMSLDSFFMFMQAKVRATFIVIFSFPI